MKEYNTIIVGAGPAGLFAAKELVEKGLEVLLIDKGRDISNRVCVLEDIIECPKCKPCNIMSGFGGAGGLSDGKLNLDYRSGVDLTSYVSKEQANELIDYVDKTFQQFSEEELELVIGNEDQTKKLIKDAMIKMTYIPIRKRHIGSDKLIGLMQRFKQDLLDKGLEIKLNTKVEDIIVKDEKVTGVITKKGEHIKAKNVILGPGRSGAAWYTQLANKHKLNYIYPPLDIGVRLETPAEIMEDIIVIDYDPKFKIRTNNYDDQVRTFCTNPNGFVVKEDYSEEFGLEGLVGVNGHARKDKKSKNTNFALLYTETLDEPQANMYDWTTSIANLFRSAGVGKPIMQMYADVKRFRRSRPHRLDRLSFEPTLKDVELGDLAKVFSYRVFDGIIGGIEKLSNIIPGLNQGYNLVLYGPEIKFRYIRPFITKGFESTNIENLFFAGDGCGLSGGIVNAAVTGVLAARGILGKYAK